MDMLYKIGLEQQRRANNFHNEGNSQNWQRYDVKLTDGYTTYVGLFCKDIEEGKEIMRHEWALSDYGVSKLEFTLR